MRTDRVTMAKSRRRTLEDGKASFIITRSVSVSVSASASASASVGARSRTLRQRRSMLLLGLDMDMGLVAEQWGLFTPWEHGDDGAHVPWTGINITRRMRCVLSCQVKCQCHASGSGSIRHSHSFCLSGRKILAALELEPWKRRRPHTISAHCPSHPSCCASRLSFPPPSSSTTLLCYQTLYEVFGFRSRSVRRRGSCRWKG